MRPSYMRNQSADGRPSEVVFARQRVSGILPRCVRLSDFFDLLCVQLRFVISLASWSMGARKITMPLAARHQPMLGSMTHVLCASAILQVLRAIVRLHTVNVVDYVAFRSLSDEGQRNQRMHFESTHWASTIKDGREVALSIRRGLQDAPFVCVSTGALTAYAAKIRHAVYVFIARNRTPFFGQKFFCVKFSVSHAVHASLTSFVNGAARLVRTFPRPFGPLCFQGALYHA